MSKIIQTNWKQIHCVGCGEQIDHDVTAEDLEERELGGFGSLMCLECYLKWEEVKVDQLIKSIAD